MDGWKLKRTVDGKRDYMYTFRNFTLKPGKVVKVHVKNIKKALLTTAHSTKPIRNFKKEKRKLT